MFMRMEPLRERIIGQGLRVMVGRDLAKGARWGHGDGWMGKGRGG